MMDPNKMFAASWIVPQIDPSVPQPWLYKSRRRPLLGPSPGWKRLLALSLLRHYAKQALTPWYLDVKLGRQHKSHKGPSRDLLCDCETDGSFYSTSGDPWWPAQSIVTFNWRLLATQSYIFRCNFLHSAARKHKSRCWHLVSRLKQLGQTCDRGLAMFRMDPKYYWQCLDKHVFVLRKCSQMWFHQKLLKKLKAPVK